MNVVSDHAYFDEQHEHNMWLLKLMREDYGWTLTRLLLAERLEAENQQLRDAGDEILVAYRANRNLDTIAWRGMVGSMARLRATLDGMS